jgi:hypothetical protein
MKIQNSLLIPKPGQGGDPLDLADRKICKQKNKGSKLLGKMKENPLLQTEFYGDSAFLTNIQTSAM